MSPKSPSLIQSTSCHPDHFSDAKLDLDTSRLNIRWLSLSDAEFILQLVNDTDWIRYIGDNSVFSLEDAQHYLTTGPLKMYRDQGHGLNRVALKKDDRPLGICGLLKRDHLTDVDLGFALLPTARGQGYAFEAAQAVLQHGSKILRKNPIQALVNPANQASIRLLLKLGFRLQPANNSSLISHYSYYAPDDGVDDRNMRGSGD